MQTQICSLTNFLHADPIKPMHPKILKECSDNRKDITEKIDDFIYKFINKQLQ